jgi:hypothetical protein
VPVEGSGGPWPDGDVGDGVGEAASTSVPPISSRIAESTGIASRSWPAISSQLGPTSMVSGPKVSS